jgi:phage/plasmid-associated DNA primase
MAATAGGDRIKKPKRQDTIADLSECILKREGAGVLNWMLEGLDRLREDNWQLKLGDRQQRVVDDLLLESESDSVFAKECLVQDAEGDLTLLNCYEYFVNYCNERGWTAMAKKRFSTAIADTVTREFGLTVRNDIPDGNGKAQRGWKGLRCQL